MAEDEERDELEERFMEIFNQIIGLATEIYNELEADYIAQQLGDSLSAGGELYNKLVDYAVASAEAWYGSYTPITPGYKPRGTLSNPANIRVFSAVGRNGTDISGSWTVDNYSDQAVYAKSGFWLYTRHGKVWRPGGLEDKIPEEIPFDIDTSEVSERLTEEALQTAMQLWG